MPRKLIDDCFRTDPRDGNRMTHDETLALIRARVQSVVGTRMTPVADACGAVLAEDIASSLTQF